MFAIAMTYLNLRGIQWTARANEVMLVVMCLVIGIFIVQASGRNNRAPKNP
jgi:amino acid transporter